MSEFIDQYLLVDEAHSRAKRFQAEQSRWNQGRVLRRRRRESVSATEYEARTNGK